MPIYQYHCTACGADLEIFQHMSDAALTQCPQCQGRLRKVFSPVGIVFKGSGFYATDSRKNSSAVKPASGTTTASPATGAASAKADAPASPPPATPTPAASTD
jgi:putative FmdB family regulatory protein